MENYENFIGKILDGRYRILELVGIGGMSIVFKAEDIVMNRVVAVKVLNAKYNGDDKAEKRFINESKAVAMLSSKNIVGVYDVAIFPDIKYIVMEYLDGITLKTYIDNKKVLPWKEACVYTLQLLHALEHAHSKNVVHRDIKPQNVILLKNGEVKVTDFGIAKTPDMAEASEDEKAIGTVYYISPEQASNKETTFASDIYSTGVMLYEMVTGILPFTSDSPVNIAMMQIHDTAKDVREIVPDIPYGVAQIINKAMEKNPEDRFRDAHSMLKAIDYIMKNPDAVFADSSDDADNDGKINIDMVDTSDIVEYVVKSDDEEEKKSAEQLKSEKKIQRKEKRNKRKKARRERPSHSIFPVISGVFFAFMIVVVIGAGYLGIKWIPPLFETPEYDDFLVRNLIGLEFTPELQYDLEENNYIISIKEVYKQGEGFNKIMEQDPATGKKRFADNKCRITLSVNKYPDDLTVPDVRYMTSSEAEKILKQYNLYAIVEYVNDEYANDKQVVSTNPEIGSYINAGSRVTLYVKRSTNITDAKTTPNVVGKKLSDAINMLEDAYYRVETVYEDSDKPDGTVLSQDVPAYTSGLEAWTIVTIKVSRYTEMNSVENYFGNKKETALSKITASGFIPGSLTYDKKSVYARGTVISQSVPAGTKAPKGTVIDLVISGDGISTAAPVPDVRKSPREEAVSKLRKAGYTVIVKEIPAVNDEDIEKVIKQSLDPGKSGFEIGTEITVTIAIESDAILVPDLSGLSFEKVLESITENGFKLGKVSFTLEGTGAEYSAVAQSPEGDSYAEKGTMINVTLYGAESNAKEAPNTVGMTENAAIKAFRNAWYDVQVVYEQAHNTNGVVLRQSVDVGTVGKIGAKVTITVCIAKNTAVVPDLSGKILDEVIDILEQAGLDLGDISYEPSSKPDGTVIGQSVDPGEEVSFNTAVDVVFSINE